MIQLSRLTLATISITSGLVGAILSTLFCIGLTRAEAEEHTKVLRAETFELLTDKGAVVGEWSGGKVGFPVMHMWRDHKEEADKDWDKNLQVRIGAFADGPGMMVYDHDGKRRIELGSGGDAHPDAYSIIVRDFQEKVLWKAP